MNAIELKWENDQKGAFVIEEGNERIAEMVVGISNGNLTVYHTQVLDKLKGQGLLQNCCQQWWIMQGSIN